MKNLFKKSFCILLCVLVAFSSSLSVAAGSFSYPSGVSEKEALNAVYGTDKLLNNVMALLGNENLSSSIKSTLYTSETLSNLLVNTYAPLEEMSKEMQLIGVDASVKKLSAALGKYPKICVALYNCDTWADVDLTGISWGSAVNTREGFAEALGAVFSPFNDILYTLLCGGVYKMNPLVTINGANGYENAIVPFLESLGCSGLPSQVMFNLEAQANKNTMVKNIVLPVLTKLETALESPAVNLTEILPRFAYFVDSGEFNECFNKLLEPITTNPLVEIAVFLKILDLDSLTNIDVNQLLSSMMSGEEGGLKLAEINFSSLAACGVMTESGYVADKGKAYIEIVRWLVETLKLNKDNLGAVSLGTDGSSMDLSFLLDLLGKDTDALTAMLVLLFTPAEIGAPEKMVYPEFKKGSVQNTTKLTDKNLQTVYNEIDGLLDQFVKEGGGYGSVGAMLTSSVYTNENINAALVGIYKMLEEEGLGSILSILGMNTSPKGVAALLGDGYNQGYNALVKADSWADVNLKGVRWGFQNGSRRGFQNALTAVLRPLFPLLRTVLAGENMVILDSITITGADGYNTAIIPVVEALGCNPLTIKSYNSYKNHAYGDGVLKNVLDPVFDMLDKLANKPVQTIVDILPNVVYFMESGSLEKCISNLLLPITSMLNRVPGVVDFKLDATELTKNLDLNTLMSSLLKDSGIKMPEFDIKSLASLGTATQKVSKSVIGGEKVKYTYIEADRDAIILSLLKLVAKLLKTPGNETLLMGSMGSGGNMNFDTSSMTAQFESMSEDEFIEWLYNLFFKERVQFEIVKGEDYSPTIIYKPAEKDYTVLYIISGYLGLCAIVGVIFFINRKRLYGDAED